MRKLKDATGNKLAAPEGFRYYRDDLPSKEAAINDQRKRFDKVFRDAAQGERQARATSISPGTSPSPATTTSPSGCCTSATTPSPSSATPTSPTASSRAPRRRSRSTPRREQPERPGDRPPGHRHVHGPVLPDQQLRGAGRRSTSTRTATRSSTAPTQANFDCIIPHAAVDDPGAAPARPSLYGHGLLGSADEVGARPAAHPRPGARLRLLRDRRDRLRRARTSRTRSGSSATSATSPSSPTASSRGCSTSSSSAG